MSHIDPTQAVFTAALERLAPTLDAIPESKLEPIRHDIGDAVFVALGIAPSLDAYREEVRVRVGEDFALKIDALADTARAAAAAHARYVATQSRGELPVWTTELARIRRVLLAEARSLVSQKHMPPGRLAELVGGTSSKDLCFDVLQLVSAFRREWERVAMHTSTTRAELDHAEALTAVVLTTRAVEARAHPSDSPAGLRRLQAYTHFVRTYDDVRRAIGFVRWDEGDADQILPSLDAGRGRRAPKDDGDDDAPDGPAGPATA